MSAHPPTLPEQMKDDACPAEPKPSPDSVYGESVNTSHPLPPSHLNYPHHRRGGRFDEEVTRPLLGLSPRHRMCFTHEPVWPRNSVCPGNHSPGPRGEPLPRPPPTAKPSQYTADESGHWHPDLSIDHGEIDLESHSATTQTPSPESPASASTLGPSEAQIQGVAGEVHEICLRSTQEYLLTHRLNYMARSGVGNLPAEIESAPGSTASAGFRRHSRTKNSQCRRSKSNIRYSPYSSPSPKAGSCSATRTPSPQPRRASSSTCCCRSVEQQQQQMPAQLPIPQATDSLLTNVSKILDFVWKRAQGARCHTLGVEAFTIREMGRVLAAAEQVVVAAMEVYTSSSVDGYGDLVEEMSKLEKAGTVLARWLGDEDGVAAIRDAVGSIVGSAPSEDEGSENGGIRE